MRGVNRPSGGHSADHRPGLLEGARAVVAVVHQHGVPPEVGRHVRCAAEVHRGSIADSLGTFYIRGVRNPGVP